ncbi:MAG: ATP-binding protein [Bryobacteraceae bacterium]|nr:ATP-binding protein [Bryobacteraceae bacterium]
MKRLPLLWRVFLSTSLFTTLLFVLIGYIVQSHSSRTTSLMLAEELQSSFRAYESLWKSRSEQLASISRVISGMPDVRAAFGTGDGATIRDTAGELWARVSQADAAFFVTDPEGNIIASLSNSAPVGTRRVEAVTRVVSRFPQQSSGFTFLGEHLHQVVITPVYVESSRGPALINVLVAGFPINDDLARSLRELTGGSDTVFTASGRVIGSTLDAEASKRLAAVPIRRNQLEEAKSGAETWSVLATALNDVTGEAMGELRILRPITSASQRIADLRIEIAWVWAAAMLFALAVTFMAAHKLLAPLKLLDIGAREVARGNYAHQVPLDGDDEIGNLGRTFNAMSASLRQSREDLIRQERINTLGRIASSVVHDLRNPLAAIYSGAELLVDSEGLPPAHTKRLASNIYRASRQVLTQLDDLLALTRGNTPASESCRLVEILEDAWAGCVTQAEQSGVTMNIRGDKDVEVTLSRPRIERVFGNLFANAIQAMPHGGRVDVEVDTRQNAAVIRVKDTGPGVPAQIRNTLFQPFTTLGKSNGLGLGLALSRQTVLEHGGDLSLAESDGGACFELSIPLVAEAVKG